MSWSFDDLDAVLEFDALDDFPRLIFAFQSPPGFAAAENLGLQRCARPEQPSHCVVFVGNSDSNILVM